MRESFQIFCGESNWPPKVSGFGFADACLRKHSVAIASGDVFADPLSFVVAHEAGGCLSFSRVSGD
jgi:hypothetical protein